MKTRRLSFVRVLPIVAVLAIPGVAAGKTAATSRHASALRPGPVNQLSAGSVELTPNVSFSHWSVKREGYGNVDTFTQFDFNPAIGFCFTNHLEAMGGMLLRHQSQNGSKETALGASAGLNYNFAPQGRVIPFAGVGFGTFFNDGFTFNNTSVLAPSLTGGIRVLVGSAGSVNLSLGYQHETDGSVSTNRVLAGVGVSLFPWRVRPS
jgi:hypothetical protein